MIFSGRKANAKGQKSVQLSKNFNLSEFMRSSSVPELSNYVPKPWQVNNLRNLANLVLQPARDSFGPITVTSGARPKDLKNSKGETFYEALKAAGHHPAKNSIHDYFGAADIKTSRNSKKQAWKLFNFISSLPGASEVIIYLDKDKEPTGIIHVSTPVPERPIPRKRFVMWKGDPSRKSPYYPAAEWAQSQNVA